MHDKEQEESPTKVIEDEFQRRYKTRNLFKPNAGAPDEISEVEKKARELSRRKPARQISKRTPDSGVYKGNGTYRKQVEKTKTQETRKPDFDLQPELPIIKPVMSLVSVVLFRNNIL